MKIYRPLVILLGLFLALLLVIGFSLPKYQNLKLLKLKVKAKEIEFQAERKYFSEIAESKEKLKKFEEELSKINSAIPPEPSLPSLGNFLQIAASQNGLILKKIMPSPSSRPKEEFIKKGFSPGIKETGLNLTVSGDYPSFKHFLSNLEKTARMIEIESISFSSSEKEAPIDFNLRIKVYSY
jgi:Tfp pilus assembly protein PilO